MPLDNLANLDSTPPGYSDAEWREHREATLRACADGTTPPPVRCHDADGRLMFTLHYRDGEWVTEYPPSPPPKTPAPRLPDNAGFVYFVGAVDGPVKIGTAANPESRLVTLQTGNPHRLSILALSGGGRRQEVAYHARFAASRLHGEWFERTPDLLAEIDRLNRKDGR